MVKKSNRTVSSKIKQTVKKSNQVIPSKGGWVVKRTEASRAYRRFKTKEEAIECGVVLSIKERTVLYIHKKDGTVQNRYSYENASFPAV